MFYCITLNQNVSLLWKNFPNFQYFFHATLFSSQPRDVITITQSKEHLLRRYFVISELLFKLDHLISFAKNLFMPKMYQVLRPDQRTKNLADKISFSLVKPISDWLVWNYSNILRWRKKCFLFLLKIEKDSWQEIKSLNVPLFFIV